MSSGAYETSNSNRKATPAYSNDAAHVTSTGLDILTYDNQAVQVAVIEAVNLSSAAIPAGCKRILVTYNNFNWQTAGDEHCFIRWNAAAVQNTSMIMAHGDRYILEVPETGDRKLNVIGQTGVTAGSFVRIVPLG